MPKQSVKGLARDALRADVKARKALLPEGEKLASGVPSLDSFVNLAQGLGIGADNALTGGTYGFNPITRNRVMLEWIHRGSWLGGQAVDVVADDMTRAGVEQFSDLKPDANELIEHSATVLRIWDKVNETIKWSRLYGGAICVALIDGQDPRTPLTLDTVGPGAFKGLLVLDRWMVEPSLEDLVTDFGPHLGLPKYYRVQPNAPAMRGAAIHHSRVMLRMVGTELPYQQQLTEQLWGTSVLERLYDRMVAFDSASMGAAQLVYKIYLRTLKIKGLREIVAAGGQPLKGVYAYVDMMRRFQGIEGITMVDQDDEFDVQQHSALSGLSDILNKFGEQLSGALQIPLVRLFGQSPGGLSTDGDSALRTYYDHINQRQYKDLHTGTTNIYMLLARSKGIQLPPNFAVEFSPLWQLQSKERSEVASSTTDAITKAKDGGLISDKVAMKELRQSSRVTGIFTNITDEDIEAASDELGPPLGEMLDGLAGLGLGNDDPTQQEQDDDDQPPQPPGRAGNGPGGRAQLHTPPAPGGPPGGRAGQGAGPNRASLPRRILKD
jgi:phage-related protein (TIGR01555 family)